MKQIIVVAFPKGLNEFELLTHGNYVYKHLYGNPNFKDPLPKLEDLLSFINALDKAIKSRTEGEKWSVNAVKDAEKNLRRILRGLASYVEVVGNNVDTVILSSGFTIKKNGGKAARSFSAKQGSNSGTVDLIAPSSRKAAYRWEMSLSPTEGWSVIDVTNISETTITGLNPGEKYWFRVSVIDGKTKGPYTDAYMVHVI